MPEKISKSPSEIKTTGVERFPDDKWESGAPMDLISIGGTIVKYTLPNGDRITTTGADHQKWFPAIFNNEARWKNWVNRKKRFAMGIADENDKVANGIDEAFFKSEIERRNTK